MFRAMDANQHEMIFERGCGNFMRVQAYANLPRKEIFDGKRAGKIAQRQIIVKLHKQFPIKLTEKILPRNLACANGVECNRGLVAKSNQQLRSARNVALADEQIEVAVAAHTWVGISLDSQDRSLDDQCSNFILVEEFEQAKELSRQTKRQEILRAPVLGKRLLDFARNGDRIAIAHACRELAKHAMLASQQQQSRPIDGSK